MYLNVPNQLGIYVGFHFLLLFKKKKTVMTILETACFLRKI